MGSVKVGGSPSSPPHERREITGRVVLVAIELAFQSLVSSYVGACAHNT